MRNLMKTSFSLLALAVGISTSASAVTLFVYPSYGPNYLDASALAYEQNSVHAMETGSSTGGTINTPQYYSQITTCAGSCSFSLNPGGFIATSDNPGSDGFTSWNGSASPAAPFNNEYGNNLYYGLSVFSTVAFNPDAITWSALGGAFTGDLSGTAFGATTFGYSEGCTGGATLAACVGGGLITSGGSSLVNGFFFSGIQLYALELDSTQLAADIASLTGTVVDLSYSLIINADNRGTTDTEGTVVPEPGTLLLLGGGFIAFGLIRKRVRS
jgi:hypothetical protein